MTNRNTAIAKTEEITIHTDGSCHGNPGPGGYAAVLRRLDNEGSVIKRRTVTGGDVGTTNNRMEMMAAIRGLREIKANETTPITVYSDSQILIKGMNEWLPGWIAKGWRKSNGKQVENKDLWQALSDASQGKNVRWAWVKGHSGNQMNEKADALAKAEAEKMHLCCFNL